MRQAICTTAEATLRKVIDAFPWRNADDMHAQVPRLVARVREASVDGGVDPLVDGRVDEILPAPEAFLTPMDAAFLWKEVGQYIGMEPVSRLHFYEVVYHIGLHDPRCLLVTRRLFHSVFMPMWEKREYALGVGDV